jgi:hypothetical protein
VLPFGVVELQRRATASSTDSDAPARLPRSSRA